MAGAERSESVDVMARIGVDGAAIMRDDEGGRGGRESCLEVVAGGKNVERTRQVRVKSHVCFHLFQGSLSSLDSRILSPVSFPPCSSTSMFQFQRFLAKTYSSQRRERASKRNHSRRTCPSLPLSSR